MSHSLANLEHHHFKYALFRRPGDVHVHFFGTATLSFSDGVKTEEGDMFEIAGGAVCVAAAQPARARRGNRRRREDALSASRATAAKPEFDAGIPAKGERR
jgi:hypothetical protein